MFPVFARFKLKMWLIRALRYSVLTLLLGGVFSSSLAMAQVSFIYDNEVKVPEAFQRSHQFIYSLLKNHFDVEPKDLQVFLGAERGNYFSLFRNQVFATFTAAAETDSQDAEREVVIYFHEMVHAFFFAYVEERMEGYHFDLESMHHGLKHRYQEAIDAANGVETSQVKQAAQDLKQEEQIKKIFYSYHELLSDIVPTILLGRQNLLVDALRTQYSRSVYRFREVNPQPMDVEDYLDYMQKVLDDPQIALPIHLVFGPARRMIWAHYQKVKDQVSNIDYIQFLLKITLEEIEVNLGENFMEVTSAEQLLTLNRRITRKMHAIPLPKVKGPNCADITGQ